VFLQGLRGALDDFGIHIIELERGGFGLIPVSALDGAQAILAKNYISDDLKTHRQQEKRPTRGSVALGDPVYGPPALAWAKAAISGAKRN
jgi:hypothetical protein